MNYGDIKIYLSGGESNTDPTASLGGSKSTSTPVTTKDKTAFATLTGVAISTIDAACPIGTATFDYINTTTQLRWKSNGNGYGSYVDVGVDGSYDLVDDANIYVTVSITATSLPGSDTTDTTTISDVFNKLFDVITKAQAYSGGTDYRGFYVTNDVSDEADYLLSPTLTISYEQDTKSSGTATSATSTTITDSGKSWTSDEYKSFFVRLTGGTGAGQSRVISSNTSDTLTIPTWDTNPSTDTTYEVCASLIDFAFEDIYTEESIGTGDGSTTNFTGTLTNNPVLKGQIEITDGTETFTDWDGDGTMTGSVGGTGTITYSSGAYDITFNTAPTNGTDIKAYYSENMQTIANETTEPTSVTWKHPVTSNALDLYSTYGYLRGKGFSQAVWARRKVYKAFTAEVKYRISINGSY